ncbi:transport system permease [Listeria floridensis FSL S10-1187]|uniref:Transport system permease n=1 Tax=Listeria floridensis FSL S10-1187 TaxID=1265817 RepID=A0ABN0RFK2_9LIST|nr:iron ABC transporter permease [Listeria floridensis]EUJ32013.1 transport system permease [Listeria floridensis FSL S10-1187]
MKRLAFKWIFGAGLILLMGLILVNLTLGTDALSFSRVFAVFFGNGEVLENFILFELRLPRLLIVLLAGVSLVLSGSLLQTVLKNDLADPGIIGINSGAGVGIALFFLFVPFQVESFGALLPLAGGIGALITAAFILLFSRRSPGSLILNGIGFAFAMSGLMVLLMSSANREKVDFLAKWLSGSIWGMDWLFVWIFIGLLVLITPILFIFNRTLDLLTLNENTALNLGVRVGMWRVFFLVFAVLLAAVPVSITGSITFLGLIGPHIAKALVGPRHKLFLPVAMIIGAFLFLLADTIAMRLNLPAGILLSLIGSPYFIYLLFKKIKNP